MVLHLFNEFTQVVKWVVIVVQFKNNIVQGLAKRPLLLFQNVVKQPKKEKYNKNYQN